jgi:ornithine cyclodeaminase/alanine dehydrogenase-like protein (mu-crystallin family)
MATRISVEVVPTNNPEEVVKGSDITITVTTSKELVLKGEWLENGTRINGIGFHHGSGVRELDKTAVKKAKVVVDSKEAYPKEPGDLSIRFCTSGRFYSYQSLQDGKETGNWKDCYYLTLQICLS